MSKEKIHILGISGSLRDSSSNRVLLKIIGGWMPGKVEFILYDGLAGLPAFDDSEKVPASVEEFRRIVRRVDGVIICTPEYAFGVPGALKNALDWTVGSGDFDQKPVALITASSVGDKAHAALLHTLTALGTRLSPDTNLLIPFIRAKLIKGSIVDASTEEALRALLTNFFQSIDKEFDT